MSRTVYTDVQIYFLIPLCRRRRVHQSSSIILTILLCHKFLHCCRLIKEQEKSERQEAVRREREIRNQQLLEVS